MKKITQDLFHEFKFLRNLEVSPKLDKAAFCITKQDVNKNTYISHLYLLENNEVKQLTNGKSEASYFWADNDTIIFSSNRSEDKTTHTEFYSLSLKGGEATLAFELPLEVSSVKDLGEKYLVSATVDLNCPDYYLLTKKEQLAYEELKKDNEDYQVVDEYPYFFNGAGFINKTRNNLFLVDKKTLYIQTIAPYTLDVESFDIKDNKILLSGIDYKDVKRKWSQIYEYDINSKELTCLYEKTDMMIFKVCYENDDILVTGTYGKNHGATENPKFYHLVDHEMVLYIDSDVSGHSSVGSDSKYGHGKSYQKHNNDNYFLSTDDSRSVLYKIKNGELIKVLSYEGSIDDYCFVEDKILLIGMVEQKLQEIYLYEDNNLKQLTHLNEEILKDKYVAKPRKIIVEKNGFNVHGWVLEPIDYDPNKKYPAILDIHGGPKAAYGEVYFHEMQYWASLGYFVFYSNPRGSDGRGNVYADITREKYGTIDYEDLMDFTDKVLETYPEIDTKRVAVTGGSYGGFMTNWIIGHTDRFACAASQRSISNWMSMMLASDYGYDVPFEHGFEDIRNCTENIWRVSPVKYALNVKTPTLFIHSFEDYRCPYPEGLQMYTAIRLNGVEARMCMFKGENHELSRSGKPLHRSRRLKEITDWILKYTKEN